MEVRVGLGGVGAVGAEPSPPLQLATANTVQSEQTSALVVRVTIPPDSVVDDAQPRRRRQAGRFGSALAPRLRMGRFLRLVQDASKPESRCRRAVTVVSW